MWDGTLHSYIQLQLSTIHLSTKGRGHVLNDKGDHPTAPSHTSGTLAFPSSSLQTAFVAAFQADANEGIFVFDADFGAHHMTFY